MRSQYRVITEVLDLARERLNVSSDEKLAVAIGVSGATIARIRRGAVPHFDTAMTLLEEAGLLPVPGIERVSAPELDVPGEVA